jgi:hypothetical protein
MPLNADLLMGLEIPDRRVAYDDRDTLLYALSLGAGLGADLGLAQEQGQRVVPSFGQNLVFNDSWMDAAGVDLAMVVHGGLELTFAAPFAPAGEVDIAARIVGLTDKGEGKAAIIRHRTEVLREGRVIFTSSPTSSCAAPAASAVRVGRRRRAIPRLRVPPRRRSRCRRVPIRRCSSG